MRLSELHNGESGVIIKVFGHGGFRKRIMEMGFVRGQEVVSVLNSPLNDPVKYSIMGYEVSLRKSEAAMIEVLPKEEAEAELVGVRAIRCFAENDSCASCGKNCFLNEEAMEYERGRGEHRRGEYHRKAHHGGYQGGYFGLSSGKGRGKNRRVYKKNEINIALVGNPNSGKTSLFNALSGGSEHVGNYSGVTVDAKKGHFSYKGYQFNVTDLPGTYSLSAYSPEEIYVRKHLYEQMPDVIINAVVASNLKRNLYLTTELIDLNQRTVVALNMYDELMDKDSKLDYEHLGAMIGIPMVPTVAKTCQGLDRLLDEVIALFEGRSKVARHIHINYGSVLEPEIQTITEKIHNSDNIPQQFPARYWAMKLIEKDAEVERLLSENTTNIDNLKKDASSAAARIEKNLNIDFETAISDGKYGFIEGALLETFTEGSRDINKSTRRIDMLVANRWLGFPIFLLLMWFMFVVTFKVGAYPQAWLAQAFDWLSKITSNALPDGAFQDLIVNGIIMGVGSVAAYLPNILILYLFISFMEDSGYMARAAFIMDRLMHRMGLHGKSFIPLLMGFGCNVPAIMATRTIESRSSRLITILINPFMSCSARLPIYILLAGTFFPRNAPTIMIGMYLLGGVVAFLTARLLRKTKFKKDETPFVMELPPYRIPTLRATLKHMWEKCVQYIKKIGSVVLIASVVIWFLSYYPRQKEETIAQGQTQYEQSYIGKIGKFIEPVVKPLGLDWRASIALVSGVAAKEIVVSTLGVLYGEENDASLSEALVSSGAYNQNSAMSFMVFTLLYVPCIGTLAAIRSETGKRKWALFSLIYSILIAWVFALIAYYLVALFI